MVAPSCEARRMFAASRCWILMCSGLVGDDGDGEDASPTACPLWIPAPRSGSRTCFAGMTGEVGGRGVDGCRLCGCGCLLLGLGVGAYFAGVAAHFDQELGGFDLVPGGAVVGVAFCDCEEASDDASRRLRSLHARCGGGTGGSRCRVAVCCCYHTFVLIIGGVWVGCQGILLWEALPIPRWKRGQALTFPLDGGRDICHLVCHYTRRKSCVSSSIPCPQ